MTKKNYSKIKKEIINKTLAIFRIVFDKDIDYSLKNKKNDRKLLNKQKLPANINLEGASDVVYIAYIEELISSRKLEYFIEKVCEEYKSNQVLQDLKEDLIRLLKNIDTAEKQRRNQAPPPVTPNYMFEDVYDSQKNAVPPFNDRENRNQSSNTQNQFTFNQFVGALMFAVGCALIFGRWL